MRKTLTMFLCAAAVAGVVPQAARAEAHYSFEIFLGEQYNIATPLTIRQSGEETITVGRAEYASDAWTGLDSPYYAWRIGRRDADGIWELELVHEKITLKNKPEEVQHFEISHGYNLITLNRAWNLLGVHDLYWRFGAGVVLTHPETTVRDKSMGYGASFPDGFYISGPTMQLAINKRLHVWKGLFGVLEAKYTLSYARRVPIAEGTADVPNTAFHYLFGVGYEY